MGLASASIADQLLSWLIRPAQETPAIHPGDEWAYLSWRIGRGELPLPFTFCCLFATNQDRHATQVKTRQSLTFAFWVSRLLVR